MTEDNARKRSIRTRMAKTGESYTAARRHVVKSKEGPPTRLSVDLGKSDETIRRGSGKSWDEWFAILDAWGAEEHTHTEIARHLHEEHEVRLVGPNCHRRIRARARNARCQPTDKWICM